ncbi:2-oxoglutarate dehydrogenase E1 component [Sunxiuqinia elliptica]|uniref:oxoglutarate dehydrogenase (succinyl-transferring) n=1 Tax=Sunxiuqinia elliptica TaxID=655355 RepID=A0A4R6GWL5_9BACT|nr:2-oxoglutarate dehydrogenase E1 component [Sunxiuqinia elliptica]TDN99919.1 2-oxoglutarate dehydrogenase E1 component [Sunxiuqinia elliptica]TDO57111.1 2-oxoglutarate dehydrogenase E1 component [Sunxiuqinia elliptica]
MDTFSQVGNQEIAAVEELYQDYLKDPESVDESWKNFFKGFELARTNYSSGKFQGSDQIDKEFAILNLIHGYRQRGHLFTKTNPVRSRRTYSPTLAIENFGLEQSDLEKVFQAGNNIGIGPAKLKDIIAHLEATYCDAIGVEYVFMRHPEVITWLQQKMESSKNSQEFTPEMKKHIFYHLKLAVGFESFIHKKFVGQKRFSLEGAEALIPALDAVIEQGAELGIKEFIVGMAHRGRLNILANIMNKPYEYIFKEFYGTEYEEDISLGDVKYHLGFENEVTSDYGKKVKLSLMPNPSHLEAVAPLVEGMARSRINSLYDGDYDKLAPIVIHGDAAIAAQGVVYEVIQMSQLKGYKTGGTIHLVINNQVGFTTNYLDARSSTYCTDVAKVTRSPVFHVNGDDVEALIYTIKLAMEFRQKFNTDVFIDILCYRKYGHNEGDEPRFTQPQLYKAISAHKNPRDIYAEKLVEQGIMTARDVKDEIKGFDQLMSDKYKESEKIEKLKIKQFLVNEYKEFDHAPKKEFFEAIPTGVGREKLVELAGKINSVPEGRKFFNKVNRILADRRQMIRDNRLDWGMAELLAYGTLVAEGHPVRISGQDCERGTFAHRHAAFVFEDGDDKYFPLKHVAEKQAPFHIYNSLLSEYGVMGFEYGYALAQPNALTVWEAQFGDFSNVAQVIIDQYITSAHEKWGLMNNLVLYLPHGYEGQGPEHSSARIERFLAQAASNNMQIVVPTTPDNMFHLLRRHLKWQVRVPLIIFTPKSLLRHPMVSCTLEELSKGHFQPVIDDHRPKAENVKQVVFTSGRLYYDLAKKRVDMGDESTAIVRVEQLYPLPVDQIESLLKKYDKADRIIWAQDEPANMGAWPFINRKLSHIPFEVASRSESGSPAGGLMKQHNLRLNKILEQVFREQELAKA